MRFEVITIKLSSSRFDRAANKLFLHLEGKAPQKTEDPWLTEYTVGTDFGAALRKQFTVSSLQQQFVSNIEIVVLGIDPSMLVGDFIKKLKTLTKSISFNIPTHTHFEIYSNETMYNLVRRYNTWLSICERAIADAKRKPLEFLRATGVTPRPRATSI